MDFFKRIQLYWQTLPRKRKKGLKIYKNMKDIDINELFEKYKYTAGIFQDKISFNADNIILAISYHM